MGLRLAALDGNHGPQLGWNHRPTCDGIETPLVHRGVLKYPVVGITDLLVMGLRPRSACMNATSVFVLESQTYL